MTAWTASAAVSWAAVAVALALLWAAAVFLAAGLRAVVADAY